MSSAFVNQLRARSTVRMDGVGAAAATITFRVQVLEAWDAVRIEASADTPVLAVKARALAELYSDAEAPEEFVVKLNGFEVLDEGASLRDVGVKDGSTLLVTYRRRRPIRSGTGAGR